MLGKPTNLTLQGPEIEFAYQCRAWSCKVKEGIAGEGSKHASHDEQDNSAESERVCRGADKELEPEESAEDIFKREQGTEQGTKPGRSKARRLLGSLSRKLKKQKGFRTLF